MVVNNVYLHKINEQKYGNPYTEFRGRGDEIHVRPLTFREVADFRDDYSQDMIREYMLYGGLPQVVLENDVNKKVSYLEQQMEHTYLRDIKERYEVRQDSDLSELVDIMASCVGGLTNSPKIADTFKSVKHSSISVDTIRLYLEYMEDAFVLERVTRYDIKGRKYIDSPFKYYFDDLGLRNARLGFRQVEPTHMMENIALQRASCYWNEGGCRTGVYRSEKRGWIPSAQDAGNRFRLQPWL